MEYEIRLIIVTGIKINLGADLIFDNNGKVKAIATELIGRYNTFQKKGCFSITSPLTEMIKFRPKKINTPTKKLNQVIFFHFSGITIEM